MVRQALVILIILFMPRPAWAQACAPQAYDGTSAPDFNCPSPGEETIVPQLEMPNSLPIRAGQTIEAPFDGALVARERLQLMGVRLRAVRRLRWLDGRYAQQRADIRGTATAQVHDAQQRQLIAHRDYYRTAAEQARGDLKWYSSFWFGFVTGAVVAVILAGVSIWGVSQLAET